MKNKTAMVRLVKLNGQAAIAPRKMPTAEIKTWFEESYEEPVDDFKVVSLLERSDGKNSPSWAEIIEQTEFAAEDLPLLLINK